VVKKDHSVGFAVIIHKYSHQCVMWKGKNIVLL